MISIGLRTVGSFIHQTPQAVIMLTILSWSTIAHSNHTGCLNLETINMANIFAHFKLYIFSVHICTQFE